MALPKLNNFPKYELKIPSTGKTVNYRPYLVSEEKVLLMAMESQDSKQILTAIKDTIGSCIEGEFDSNNLAMFDIEYMFIQLRSKSVGEGSKVRLKCSACEEYTDLTVDLSSVPVPSSSVEKTIKLTDDISLEMKYPTYTQMLELDSLDAGNNTQAIFWMIRQCIHAISTQEERFLAKDTPPAELDEFISSMTNDQFAKLTHFVENMPKLEHTIEYDCAACSVHNTHKFEGMADFF